MIKYVIYSLIIVLMLFVAKVAWKWLRVFQSNDYHQMLSHLYDHSIQTIDAESLKNLQSCTLLDCREKKEFEISSIPNAIFAGYSDFTMDSFNHLDKNDTIVVYCSVGYRSEKIGEKFVSAGYNHVYNLYGGIFEWINSHNDVVVPEGQQQQIHCYSASWKKWINRQINIIHD